ncbi:unnamed protein product [Didymodactylos carnosus]|uniref:Uncharacterized protein n=1 Tax=Didymodactylos carnosus TaxID=1234261 RepID=A0A814NNW2_9BILA|nr:unnamed protein product [Didymodactylos carnosus]CAF1096304.1 unnamed protein product [Didymodactylos carnosus]CAF3840327.1 unnamed protein product [Didymodactylos carnosus]CAF3861580.1 unnamed protein product [Didymodactylos carnosus]
MAHQTTHRPPAVVFDRILSEIHLGLTSSVRGFILAWNNDYVWKTQLKSFSSLLISTLTVYVVIVCFCIPFRMLLWFLSFSPLFNTETYAHLHDLLSPSNLLVRLCWFIPLFAVFVMNNLLGYEKVFFSVLYSLHPTFAYQLQLRPRQKFLTMLYYFIRRTTILLGFVMLINLFRSVPLLGRFVPALWLLNYVRHTLSHTKSLAVRVVLLSMIAIVAFFEPIQSYAMSLLHIQLAATSLARELFDTYLSRLHHTKTPLPPVPLEKPQVYSNTLSTSFYMFGFQLPKIIQPLPLSTIHELAPHKHVRHFLRKHYVSLLIFTLPYVFLLSIPLFGFFCVGFAHGAAAYALLAIMQAEIERKQQQQ